MKTYFKIALTCSLLSLAACGGSDDSSSIAQPSSNASTFSVSETSVTFSGKRFRDLPDRQRISLDYDQNVVDYISIEVAGLIQIGELVEGANNNLFRWSINNDDPVTYVDVFPVYSNMEGGTYVDELTLQPRLLDGTTGSKVTVDLTLLHEPTTPITVELNDADDAIVELTEGGAPVRVAATVNAGNAISWESRGTKFIQDASSVWATASDPEEGFGTEQVNLVITPTPTLIETLKDDSFFNLPITFEDKDGDDNYFTIYIEARLADPAQGE